jgi:TRAP-type C4-dicarboxylate transport system substrate-binding protein
MRPASWPVEALMFRRQLLKTTALAVAGAMAGGLRATKTAAGRQTAPSSATKRPIRIRMVGYGPPSTGYSLALKRIGDRLKARFGDEVDVKYVYNVLDLGYREDDINWLVDEGVLTLGYQSSGYLSERVPDLGVADLPFLFPDVKTARAAIDGRLGQVLAAKLEARMNYRVLGYFEAAFTHFSNRLRPIRTPADMKGLRWRVRPSKVQARTFELLGAEPKMMDLSEFIEAVKARSVDAQENAFSNTVTYGVHKFHRFHSATNQCYVSRPVFVHRPSFDAWPQRVQEEMRAAAQDAIIFQRELHVKEEDDAMAAIRIERGEILELSAQEREAFIRAISPIYGEARSEYGRDLLGLVGL